MVAPSALAHIVFRTKQLETMIEWYCAVLEAHIVTRVGDIAFLTYDHEHHRVALIGADNLAEPEKELRVGFYHAAFSYSTLSDLLDTGDRLEELGIVPWRVINHGPTISYYYQDPDGNHVELQVDRFENANDATALMNGAAFRKNPVGVIVDPRELRMRLNAGEPIAEVMRRPDED